LITFNVIIAISYILLLYDIMQSVVYRYSHNLFHN